jgi:hypothetical protein
MFNSLRHIHRRREPAPMPTPPTLHLLGTDTAAPINCVTRHESVGGVVLLGHDHLGRVQIEVRLPDAESSAPELLGALLGWFMDLHTAASPAVRLAASKVPPTRAD